MSYKTELQANNADIRALIEQAKALPDAGSGGVELPELTDPAEENDVRAGKEYIDATGAKAYGRLFMDTVLTPGWEARIPVEVQYDSDDRYLVMTDGSGRPVKNSSRPTMMAIIKGALITDLKLRLPFLPVMTATP